MKIASLTVGGALSVAAALAFAADHGTRDQAVAMTKKAVAAYNANAAGTIADINAGKWRDRDLYPMIYDGKGVNRAHGANPKLIGRDLSQLKDATGKPIIPCILQAGDADGGRGGWCDYQWPNPVTKAVEAKSTYVEKSKDGLYVGVGFYK